ncbi:MAG: hypothetical protein K0S48_3016 [Ramlibacter sp.]|jgi:hypothetical protein|nr:hypothetical protein [Ramlibacter sp.]MCE3272003.1 hypothetical protein [Ramlibacter sp.]
MRSSFRSVTRVFTAGLVLAAAAPVQAQSLSTNYDLTVPSLLSAPEFTPEQPVFELGPVRLAGARSSDGSGLSLEAGRSWFARVGVGRSLDSEVVSVGGGYRFRAGDALSMHVTRQLGQERLGLAVRYDWQRSYMRLSYDTPDRAFGLPDRLRFSAGVRF